MDSLRMKKVDRLRRGGDINDRCVSDSFIDFSIIKINI